VTKALLHVLAASGVTITHEQTPERQHRVTAVGPDTRDTYLTDHADLYAVVSQVAQGVKLDVNAGQGGAGSVRYMDALRRLGASSSTTAQSKTIEPIAADQPKSVVSTERAEEKVPSYAAEDSSTLRKVAR